MDGAFSASPTNSVRPTKPAQLNKPRALDLFTDPREWVGLAPGDRPTELEIGSGKGLFLQNAASANPEHHFVGIELAAKFANKAAERLAKHGLANAIMLRGDAKRFLSQTVPDAALVRLHVYFPDPWWRNKHKKRRVLNEQTLADIQRTLIDGGQFHFWTDVLDYYEHICTQVMESTELTGPHYVPQRAVAHAMDYTTHFERRARINSQPVYRAVFIKPTRPAQPDCS
jgi:tRNA (guanine-N7-)-methyltransferase